MTPWADALLSAALHAIDPKGLGPLVLRARAGPARDRLLAEVTRLWGGITPLRIGPGIDMEGLDGGLDLTATLRAGKPVFGEGILARAEGRVLIMAMAERTGAGLGARLAQAFDTDVPPALILLDEGAEEGEVPPAALLERAALRPMLEGVRLDDTADGAPWSADEIIAARGRCPAVPDEAIEALTACAVSFGIDSLRAPLLAMRCARALAALEDAPVGELHIEMAARLVLAPRALCLPAPPDAEETPPEPEPEQEKSPDETPADDTAANGPLEDRVEEAVRAALPADVLSLLAAAGARLRTGKTTGAGDEAPSKTRGRPLGSARGLPRDGARVDLVATLRTAAPWQAMRGGDRTRLRILPDDLRIKRFRNQVETVLIFAVDASGSAAMARLAEVKGAIELILAQAYSRREQVALISFRGPGAEVLLPPTNALALAKRRLAGLPGGGGTPLASGLRAVLDLAGRIRREGARPVVAILTDGKGNVALDGTPGRARAREDAAVMARALRAAEIDAIVIDAANRPQEAARLLAQDMGATYCPLPRADAAALSGALAGVR